MLPHEPITLAALCTFILSQCIIWVPPCPFHSGHTPTSERNQLVAFWISSVWYLHVHGFFGGRATCSAKSTVDLERSIKGYTGDKVNTLSSRSEMERTRGRNLQFEVIIWVPSFSCLLPLAFGAEWCWTLYFCMKGLRRHYRQRY